MTRRPLLIEQPRLGSIIEEVWEGLMVWVGDKERDVAEIAHMMETVWLGCCSKNIS